jgi:hypothetical protein
MASVMAPSRSQAELVHAHGGGHLHHRLLLTAKPSVGRRSAHHHSPQHQEWGSPSSLVLILAIAIVIHHTHNSKHSTAAPKI